MKYTPAPAADRYVTRRQAAEMNVESRALRRAERTGELQAFKSGKHVLYARCDVLALVERSRVVPSIPERTANVEPIDPFERAACELGSRGGKTLER